MQYSNTQKAEYYEKKIIQRKKYFKTLHLNLDRKEQKEIAQCKKMITLYK